MPGGDLERRAIFASTKHQLFLTDLVRTGMDLTTALPSERTRAFRDGRLAGRVLAAPTTKSRRASRERWADRLHAPRRRGWNDVPA